MFDRYRPSGTAALNDLAILALASTVGGIVTGISAYAVAQWIWLLVVFPAMLGLLLGFGLSAVVRWRRIRAPILAGMLGGAAGAIAWVTDLALTYRGERAELRTEVASLARELEADLGIRVESQRIEWTVDQTLLRLSRGEELTTDDLVTLLTDRDPTAAIASVEGSPFLAWVNLTLDAGSTISSTSTPASIGGTQLGRTGTMVVWGVDLLIFVIVPMGLAGRAAWQPFCDVCRSWYVHSNDLVPLTSTRREVLDEVARGEARFLTSVADEPPANPFIATRLRHCPTCSDAPVFVEVLQVKTKKDTVATKTLACGMTARASQPTSSLPTLSRET